MYQQIIAQLKTEIAIEEIEIKQRTEAVEEKRIAVRVLEQRARSENPKPTNVASIEQIKAEAQPPARRMSVAAAVVAAVNQLRGQEIYVGNVHPLVTASNVELPADPSDLRNRIGTELNRLEKNLVLAKVFKGGGNVPNRYRHAPEVEKG